MTAPARNGLALPDPAAVLKRAATLINRRVGDEVLDAGLVDELTGVVRNQIVEPLRSYTPVSGAAVAGVERLSTQVQQQAEAIRRANAEKQRVMETADRDRVDLEWQLSEKDTALEETRAERDTARGLVRDLEIKLAEAQKAAETWESEYRRVVDDALVEVAEAKAAAAVHTHSIRGRRPARWSAHARAGNRIHATWSRSTTTNPLRSRRPGTSSGNRYAPELRALGFPDGSAG